MIHGQGSKGTTSLPVTMHKCLILVHTPMNRIMFSCRTCLFIESERERERETCQNCWFKVCSQSYVSNQKRHSKKTHLRTLISCLISAISISVKFCTRSSPIATASYFFFCMIFVCDNIRYEGRHALASRKKSALIANTKHNRERKTSHAYTHVCASITILESS